MPSKLTVKKKKPSDQVTMGDLAELIRGGKAASQMMTIKDVATKLNVSVRTVRRILSRNEIVGKQVGRQWRFSSESVEAYISANVTTR